VDDGLFEDVPDAPVKARRTTSAREAPEALPEGDVVPGTCQACGASVELLRVAGGSAREPSDPARTALADSSGDGIPTIGFRPVPGGFRKTGARVVVELQSAPARVPAGLDLVLPVFALRRAHLCRVAPKRRVLSARLSSAKSGEGP
jgi:hypothetical protein